MKKQNYILWIVVFAVVSLSANAQSTFSLQYSMGFGIGDLRDFNTTTSFRGATIEWRKMIQPNLGIGLDAGWNVFYERRAYDTYTSGTQSLSGVQYRYTNAFPILLSGSYFLKPGAPMNPFVGFGVGTLYVKREVDMNLYAVTIEDWQFAIKPEVGVLINANPGMDVMLALKYYAGFATNDLAGQSYMAFNIGFVFKNQ